MKRLLSESIALKHLAVAIFGDHSNNSTSYDFIRSTVSYIEGPMATIPIRYRI